MNRILKSITIVSLLLLGITASCNMPVEGAKATETPTRVLVFSSTETAVPTLTSIPPTPTLEFAPFCNADMAIITPAAKCQMPIASEITKFCVEKKPYNLIYINRGSTYTPLTGSFICTYEGAKENRQMISCTGTKSESYEIRVCDPACAIPTAQAAIIKCPQDYNYNDIQGCCTKEIAQPTQPNCFVLKLDTPKCALKCRSFNAAECLNHAYSCTWLEGRCEQRK